MQTYYLFKYILETPSRIQDEEIAKNWQLDDLWKYCQEEKKRLEALAFSMRYEDGTSGEPENFPDYRNCQFFERLIIEEKNRRNGVKEPEQEPEGEGIGTAAQQLLAIQYLLEQCEAKHELQKDFISFVRFLTGRHPQTIKEKHLEGRNLRPADLKTIRPFFEKMGLAGILQKIDSELNKDKDKKK